MNIKRAKEEIINTVKSYLLTEDGKHFVIPSVRQRPILLIGPPGIGKTAIMEQAASECGIGFVSYTMTHHTRQSALGLPFIEKRNYRGKEYSVTEYTMSEIIAAVYDKIQKTGMEHGILFIDEINCVSETLAPVMLQFLQNKTFGNAKVPEGWIITAAGNPPEYNRSVREFDVVTLDRVKLIEVEADYPAWRAYALRKNIHSSILSYLSIKEDNFYKIETTVNGINFVTARGWEDLSELIYVYEKLDIPTDAEVIQQYVHDRAIAVDFSNFLELHRKYHTIYQIENVLEGVFDESIKDKVSSAPFDEKISIVGLILGRLNAEFIDFYQYDSIITEVYGVLKDYNRRLHSNVSVNPKEEFKLILEQMVGKYTQIKESHQSNSGGEIEAYRVIEILNRFYLLLTEADLSDAEVSFERLRKEFLKFQEKRETMLIQTSSHLEHAFDFLEKAFKNGPEVILFVTELSAGYYSLKFIQENGSERFYEYSKKSVHDESQDIMEEIEKVEHM